MKRNRILKSCIAAVLLAAMGHGAVWAAGEDTAVQTFSTGITGNAEKDTAYAEFIQNGVYTFSSASLDVQEPNHYYTADPGSWTPGTNPDGIYGIQVDQDQPESITVQAAGDIQIKVSKPWKTDTGTVSSDEGIAPYYLQSLSMRGISNEAAGKSVTLTAGSVGITADSATGRQWETGTPTAGDDYSVGEAFGIYASADHKEDGDRATVTVTAPQIAVNAFGKTSVFGAYASGNSTVALNGDVTMKKEAGDGESTWGVNGSDPETGKEYGMSSKYAFRSTAGLFAANGGQIEVNGDADLAVNGTGLAAYLNGADITVKGDVNILTNVNRASDKYHYALAASHGTVNVNVNEDKTAGSTHTVNLIGNVGVLDFSGEGTTAVNLGLTTADSTWSGLVLNNFSAASKADGTAGKLNLWLQNGATWTNEESGSRLGAYESEKKDLAIGRVDNFTGGADGEHAGNIVQKSADGLSFQSYSGFTNIFYEHTGDGTDAEDYAAGDTTIAKAAEGSGVTLITDNTGVTMSDDAMVASVLNALAGKLCYTAYTTGETNLTGKVAIASGLTASSEQLSVGDITFDSATGQGSYVSDTPEPPEGQTKTDFTTTLTGVKDNDTEYTDGGVLQADGSYVFTKDSTITVSGSAMSGSGLNVQADGQVLHLVSEGKGTIFAVDAGNNSTIQAKTLDITAHSEDGRAEGIHVLGKQTIDGDVNLNVHGVGYTLGIYAGSGANGMTINGDVTANTGTEGDWAIDNGDVVLGQYYVSALYAGYPGGGGGLTINGNVDLAVNGNGAMANTGGGTITIAKGGSIEVNPENKGGYYALGAMSGTVNMNVVLDESGKAVEGGTSKVNILGNIGAATGAVNGAEATGETTINLGLTTDDSTWTGVAYNGFGEEGITSGKTLFTGNINVWLNHGAVWTNEAYGIVKSAGNGGEDFSGSLITHLYGGDNAGQAGHIIQKDANPLTISNYSGFTTIYYAHTEDGTTPAKYTGGDTYIRNAAAGSSVTLYTDNRGITMTDDAMVSRVLDALAHKLYYTGYLSGEENLTGQVGIAEGLTASGKYLELGNIIFDETTGQGAYDTGTEPPIGQTGTEFTSSLTGVKDEDQDYVDNHVYISDGKYVFTKDSTIQTSDSAIKLDESNAAVAIDAAGTHLALSVSYDGFGKVAGILNGSQPLTIQAKTISIDAQASGMGISMDGIRTDAGDITITGDTSIHAGGAMMVHGIYAKNGTVTLNGDLAMKGEDGSWGVSDADGSTSSYNGSSALYASDAAAIQVNGLVDIKANGNGAYATNAGAVITMDGGSIEINKDRRGYALLSASGTVNMNVALDEAGKAISAGENDVVLKGNLGVLDNSGAGETVKESVINLGLATKDSSLTGVIDNDFTAADEADGWKGVVDLWLQNGASWTNEAYGTTSTSFAGSTVESFTGGADSDHAGNIFQNDTHGLTLDSYSGFTNIYYAHENAGTEASDYTAGDTTITKAAEGSGVTLITDNSGITMSDSDQVASVLNALAGKLYYTAYTAGEANLTGVVKIADGLTASSKELKTGEIVFDAVTGQGTYVAPEIPDQQVTSEFTTPLTGDLEADEAYVYGGVRQEDGTYLFTKDSTITSESTAQGSAAVKNTKPLVVDAAGHTLTLNSQTTGIDATTFDNDVSIKADKVSIYVTAGQYTTAKGIAVGATNGKDKNPVKAVIDGDVDVQVNKTGGGQSYGINATGSSSLHVTGSLGMAGSGDTEWGVTGNSGYTYGIYQNYDYSVAKGSAIQIDGDANLSVQHGTAISSRGGSALTIGGGGTIRISDDGQYAIQAISSKVSMNVNADATAAGNKDVHILGNIGVFNTLVGNRYTSEKESVINLGLATKDSELHGSILNTYTDADVQDGYTGAVNLWLQNGATWINESYGEAGTESRVTNFTGGADSDHAGNIFQNDANPLTLDSYSGFTNIFYAHTGDGTTAESYAAGDTTITKAAEGSGVTLITDNTGITMSDDTMVASVLNALAGKLYYTAHTTGETNLTGKVAIASGLTASSAQLSVGDITFDDKTGQGTYVAPEKPDVPEPPADGVYHKQIIESKHLGDANRQYWTEQGISQTAHTYSFAQDSTLHMDVEKDDPQWIDNAWQFNIGGVYWAGDDDGSINMNGHKLSIEMSGEKVIQAGINPVSANLFGIVVNSSALDIQNVGGLDISFSNIGNSSASGITVIGNKATGEAGSWEDGTGDASLTIHNDLDASHAVKIRYDDDAYATEAILVNGNTGTARLNIEGLVDIDTSNMGYDVRGVRVVGNGTNTASAWIGGGRIVVADGSYALQADGGTLSVNAVREDDGWSKAVSDTADLIIDGDIKVGSSAESRVNAAFNTADSSLYGAVLEGDENGGTASLLFANGAVWTNTGSEKGSSTVSYLTGGSDAAHSGYIIQQDTNQLTLKNYSGYTTLIYAHENAGADVADYKAGDTHVNAAEAGSVIVLSTDNNGIDMTSKDAVEKTLSALAQKLYYEEAISNTDIGYGTDKLTGKVQIADGLTASSKSLNIGDMTFRPSDGQGGYVSGSVNWTDTPVDPDNPDNPDTPDVPETGDYETSIMRGTRAAITTSLMAWRDNAEDLYNHAAVVRNGIESDGIWAKTYGGKTKYDGNALNSENSYWGAQVGYGKTLKSGWHAGLGVDYMDGDASYQMGGKGDNKLYSFGIYAGKDLGSDDYIQVAAKVGRVENDFHVYNEIGQKLTGDYKATGYSLSAKYGKRFGSDRGYIEPQAQLTWAHVAGKDFDGESNGQTLSIHQKSYDSLVGRIGVEAGQENERGGYYGRLSVAHEFSGDVEGMYSAKDGGDKWTKFDGGDTWAELTVGGQYRLSAASLLYADLTKSFGGDYEHEWKANLGIRFSF